jgi:hypothetical protein
VRRLILLAIGLSALLWTADARTRSAASDHVAMMSGIKTGQVAGDSDKSGDSDFQWRARQHTIAAVTESLWKSAPVHAAIAATPAPRTFDPEQAASSPDPPIRSALPYLRHTPLLI